MRVVPEDPASGSSRGLLVVVGFLLLAGVGWLGFSQFRGDSEDPVAASAPTATISQELDLDAEQAAPTTVPSGSTQPTVPEEPASTAPVTQQALASIAVQIDGDSLPDSVVNGMSFDPAADPAIGVLAPSFTGPQFGGEPLTFEPNGSPKILLFVAHWCPHCQREVPQIVDLVEQGFLPDDVQIYAVSTAVDESRGNYPPQAWLNEERWTFPVIQDDEAYQLFSTFGGTGFPYAVYLNSDHEVVGRATGSMEPDGTLAVWEWLEGS